MRKANSPLFQLIPLAQIFLLLCTYFSTPFALAAAQTDLDYSDLNQLVRLETIIYGSAHKNLPTEKRVESLEKILFGKTRSGSIHSRIFSIASTLTGSPDNSLSPPLAPSLDREDTLKGAAPDLASESNQSSEEADTEPPSEAKRDRINKSLQQAMQFYNQGETSQAEKIFKNVLSLDSKNADANFNLGAIAEGRGDWENALHYYQVALKGNPDDKDTEIAINNMKTKLTMGNAPKQSTKNQAKLSESQIELLKEKVNQAADDYGKGNYDSAISNLKTVLTQAPDQADVYYALGQAYKAKNNNSDAANAFAQALHLAPDNKQYANALAEINNNHGHGASENKGSDTFSSSNSDWDSDKNKSNKDKLTSQNSDWTTETPGEITPFSDQGNGELGWQPASAAGGGSYANSYYTPGMNSAYMPGYTYSNYIPYSMTSMMERAAIGSLAGAAIGSMLSPPGYRSRGAFTGGMVGGMMGFMGGGRHRW